MHTKAFINHYFVVSVHDIHLFVPIKMVQLADQTVMWLFLETFHSYSLACHFTVQQRTRCFC